MSPRPPCTETIRFLTLDGLGRLLAATRGSVHDRALFLLAYRHGLRASEVGLLRTEDLDLRALRLVVHRLKGSLSGTRPLQPDEAKALRAWLREREQPPSSILFPSNRGDPIARRTPDWLMRTYGEQADLPPAERHFPALRAWWLGGVAELGRTLGVPAPLSGALLLPDAADLWSSSGSRR